MLSSTEPLSQKTLTYKGKVLDNFKDLDKAIKEIPTVEKVQGDNQYFIASSYIMLGFVAILFNARLISPKLTLALFFLAAIPGVIYHTRRGSSLYEDYKKEAFFKPARAEYLKGELKSDQNIKQFFFVSNKEIEKLLSKAENSGMRNLG